MRLGGAVLIIIIALVALAFLVNPSLNSLVLSGINYVITHAINNTMSIPMSSTGITGGPCSSWGGLVNVNLTDGESLFIEVVNAHTFTYSPILTAFMGGWWT